MASNTAAWLDSKGATLRVGPAPMPTAGPGELVIKNRSIAINPLDWHMADWGVFIKEWPAVFGCDVAGEVHEVGENVTRFKPGDRVTAHTINLVSGKSQDGAFAQYTVVPATKAAILPDSIAFESGAVLPLAIEAAACALYKTTPGEAMPGVPTPALGLPLPSLNPKPIGKCIVVYGGSSSTGVMTTQLAVASGLTVIAIASPHNFDLCKQVGASVVLSHKDSSVADKAVEACASHGEFVGIFDAISTDETYRNDLKILSKLGGGHLACTHPPPTENVPDNVKSGMIFAVDDLAQPIWEDFITPALTAKALQCLPQPKVVGRGLEFVQEALNLSKAGVSGSKLVITL